MSAHQVTMAVRASRSFFVPIPGDPNVVIHVLKGTPGEIVGFARNDNGFVHGACEEADQGDPNRPGDEGSVAFRVRWVQAMLFEASSDDAGDQMNMTVVDEWETPIVLDTYVEYGAAR